MSTPSVQTALPPVSEFRGQYAFLSNFYPCPVKFEGMVYPSAEHAYQSAKTLSPSMRMKFKNETVTNVKRLGKFVELRPGWADMKVTVMRRILESKFTDITLRRLLRETKTAELVEGNSWGDVFWGRDVLKGGENMLGQLLMQLRSKFNGK